MYAAIKRGLDLVASVLILLVLTPILVPIMIALRLTGEGAVFYRQQRVGYRDDMFGIWKFATMLKNSPNMGTGSLTVRGDPRVTPVGKYLRSTKINELPQLLNVVTGEMSFVGPRPERPQFVDQLEEQLPYYAERHMVKPGITGWAQINYPYGASVDDARHKLEYDLYYAKNYSPFLDLLILLQTLKVVLWPSGAR